MALVPLAEAQRTLLGHVATLEPTSLPLRAALHHVLARDVHATHDVPPFDNSAMDGYAFDLAGAGERPFRLAVVGLVQAGSAGDLTVGAGQAARIMTGAPVPHGADAIVMVEQTTTSDDLSVVEVHGDVAVADHVRRAGSDVRSGQLVLEAGTNLGPSHLGLVASVGQSELFVHPRPRVGVLSTGDELVEPGRPLMRGQIRDSNRVSLIASLERDHFEAVDLGIVTDDEVAVRERIEAGLAGCDALITSGGVSVGDFDHVKRIVTELAAASGGAAASIGVAIRPAKPFAFGFVPGRSHTLCPVLSLPGNPVSSLVSYELLARPTLRKLAGHPDPLRRKTIGEAGEDFPRQPDGKTHYLRVTATSADDGSLVARSSGGQGSHQLAAMAGANALAVIPDGAGLRAGDAVGLLVFESP